MTPQAGPKVFVSYSWTSTEHVDWVVKLADRLVTNGVDVVLDQWDLKPGYDKFAFMERMVTDATVAKVLAVCDRVYAEKADGRLGGVGTESQIISKSVYDKAGQDKFIPLIREKDEQGTEYAPAFFGSRFHIDFSDDEKFEEAYDKLIRHLYDRPERTKPQLGKPPAHLFTETSVLVKPAGRLDRLKFAVLNGKPFVRGALQEYLDCYAESLEDFRILFDVKDGRPDEQRITDSIASFLPYRDNFVDFLLFAADYLNDADTLDRVHGFLENVLAYRDRPAAITRWSEHWWDNYRFMLYELYLHLLAVFLKKKQYAIAARFIEAEYNCLRGPGTERYDQCGADAFHEYMETLDESDYRGRERPAKTTGLLIAERATHPKVSFGDLFQADFLLWLRPHFPEPGACRRWYPKCLAYARDRGTLEVFAKATSKTGFDAVRHLLKVKSLRDLFDRIRAVFANQDFTQMLQRRYYLHMQLEELLNLKGMMHALGVQGS